MLLINSSKFGAASSDRNWIKNMTAVEYEYDDTRARARNFVKKIEAFHVKYFPQQEKICWNQ
jgi:hypothetical protein